MSALVVLWVYVPWPIRSAFAIAECTSRRIRYGLSANGLGKKNGMQHRLLRERRERGKGARKMCTINAMEFIRNFAIKL